MLSDEAGGGLLGETGVAVLKLGRSDEQMLQQYQPLGCI